jgi:hypothetical protein
MVRCVICDKEFESDRSLHAHLKAHKLRMAEYYQTHLPRVDQHDGKIIKFKNKEHYLNADFNNKRNLKSWLDKAPEEKAKEYCISLLKNRKQKKNLIYTPCQVELRSIMSPPIQHYNKLFSNYYELCENLGFKNKYLEIDEVISGKEYDHRYKIYIDTREQKPLKFKRPVEIKKLDFGDYAFSDSRATCNCNIERKSLPDFIGTLSGGYERFIKEIERCGGEGGGMVILVESKFSNALYFNKLMRAGTNNRVYSKVRVTPDYIFHRVRSLSQEYPFIQFLFVEGRKEAVRVIDKIFTTGCIHKKADLQLLYDLGKF